MKQEEPDIRYLFEPRSIAVVGASTSPDKIGYKVVDNIVKGGYEGKIYPINPKGGNLLGNEVYGSLGEVEGNIDVAVICIPAKYVFESVKSCSEKGVKFLVVITSGFSEVGNIDEEERIVSYAKLNGMRVLGPNIFGIYSSKVSLNATFGPSNVKEGNIAIVTQSGALGIAMIGKTAAEDLGLSSVISVGNKSDINESDLVDYLALDHGTSVILMYVEGVKDGDKLIESLKNASKKKHVVVIKSGRSRRGAMAAASHTGSLAGEDVVFDKIMGQCGVLRATSIDDAFHWCRFLSQSDVPEGENVVIITNGGGVGVMATDACEAYDLNLYDDPEALTEMFSDVMPSFGSAKNPIDITGQATAEDYGRALEIALGSENIHAVIALYCETGTLDSEQFPKVLDREFQRYRGRKPIVFSLFGGEKIKSIISDLKSENVPVFEDVYDSVSCLGALYRKKRFVRDYSEDYEYHDIDVEGIYSVVNQALAEGRHFLLAPEAKQVMKVAGIRGPKTRMAKNIKEAVDAARDIGYPVVMKIVSRDIIHKSDAGGVALDLEDEGEVMDAYQAVMKNSRNYDPGAKIEGVEISEMVTNGLETIVGARRDNAFGPIVMFGLGGIYVEVMKDVSFRAFPLTREEVMDMINDIRTYPILLGVRGEKRRDIGSIIDTIIKVGNLLNQCDAISDIEVNPLMVYEQGDGSVALDVRILLGKNRGE